LADSTPERILEAAFRTLVRRGYHETSMKDIAEEAGVAPGLAHYYFDSKEHLLVETIRHGCAPLIEEWHRRAAAGPQSLEAAVTLGHEGLELQKAELRANLDLFGLIFDMVGVSLHNPRIGAAVKEFVGEDRERIAAVARTVISALPDPPVSKPDAVAAVIWAALNGITLQRLINPDFDADQAIDALWEMIASFIAAHSRAVEAPAS
jgi:AcrR family transcriptional regulator